MARILAAAGAAALLPAQAQAQPAADVAGIVRAVDCARCHGRDYDGWAAPSIIAFVRTQGPERFEAEVLDGDVARGMPGYRNNPRVAGRIADIYRFFAGRARSPREPSPPAEDTAR
jgi:mono/diheme cytochrome c family protein